MRCVIQNECGDVLMEKCIECGKEVELSYLQTHLEVCRDAKEIYEKEKEKYVYVLLITIAHGAFCSLGLGYEVLSPFMCMDVHVYIHNIYHVYYY